MLKQWLIIDETTNLVSGWQRADTDEIPPSPAGTRVLDCDENKMQEYFDLSLQETIDRRKSAISEVFGLLSITKDERPYLEITADKTEAVADGADTIAFTVKTLNADGKPEAFNGSYSYEFQDKIYKLDFIDGVAVFEHKFDKSGTGLVSSTPDFKVKDQTLVTAVEP